MKDGAAGFSFWDGAEDWTDVELSPSSSCSRALCRSSGKKIFGSQALLLTEQHLHRSQDWNPSYLTHADSSQWLSDGSVQKWPPDQMCGPFYLEGTKTFHSITYTKSTIYNTSKDTIVCTYQIQRIPSQLQCPHHYSFCLTQEKR